MEYALVAGNQAAGRCHSPARADESQEEEDIVDFLCGLLGVILLWVRNRLGPGEDATRVVGCDQLRAAGHSLERPCDDADTEAILGRLRAAMTAAQHELGTCLRWVGVLATCQCPQPRHPGYR